MKTSPPTCQPIYEFARWSTIMAITIALIARAGSVSGQNDLASWSETVVNQAVRQIADSVVQIETIGGLERVSGVQVADGPTTGLIVSQDGFVITSSFNLIQQPSAIFVNLSSGVRLPAEIMARNESRHVVMLKVDPPSPLPVPNFLDRSQLRVGQSTIAVGKSFDAEQPNISTGILSATSRIWGRAIQTDAKISPHNFGGPLIDLEGHVLGILVPLSPDGSDTVEASDWYDSGIGFAVPLDELRLDQLALGRPMRRGLLGISFKENRGYASQPIIAASPGASPAAKAGMKPGDKIVRINQSEVRRVSDARQLLGPLYENDEVSIAYERAGAVVETNVTLVGEIRPFRHAMLGILPDYNAVKSESGVDIRHVFADGPAALAGIKKGDQIVAIEGVPINHSIGLAEQMITCEIGETISVAFRRDGAEQQTTISLTAVTADPVDQPLDENANHEAENGDEGSGRKVSEIKVPEQPNRCFAYVPNVGDDRPLGILLWLGPPGKLVAEEAIKPWKSWCERRSLILLVPESRDVKAWDPREIEFFAKVVQQVSGDFDVNPQRICVGGTGSGGVMASLVAMSKRSVFRGLVLHNSPISERIGQVRSSAIDRLLVSFVISSADEKTNRRIENDRQRLTESGFPVNVMQTQIMSDKDSTRLIPYQQIIDWLDTIDRL